MSGRWTEEYKAYSAAHGRTPEDQMRLDEDAWPGGRMTGFILWVGQCIAALRREQPEAVAGCAVFNHKAKIRLMRERGREFLPQEVNFKNQTP